MNDLPRVSSRTKSERRLMLRNLGRSSSLSRINLKLSGSISEEMEINNAHKVESDDEETKKQLLIQEEEKEEEEDDDDFASEDLSFGRDSYLDASVVLKTRP